MQWLQKRGIIVADIVQIKQQIRFQLDQLSVNNAHHDFEHLCRYLTRAKICSNILPATGPVSAGGDQGRDFETFRTFLQSTPIANSTFIGLASDKTIAFACSLQKKETIIAKIRSDVSIIMGSGSEVDFVYYFCSSDIPVGRRHELETWARENYSIELIIFVGQAISEELADPEVFWIAEKYLEIPSEMFPRRKDENEWYSQLREEWRTKDQLLYNFGEFFEIKSAIRYATSSKNEKVDLMFWKDLLEAFLTNECDVRLKRKAVYEIAVASLKGLETLRGQEDRLKEYFNDIPQLEDSVEFEESSTLLMYCFGALQQNAIQLTFEDLDNWHDKLLTRVEEILAVSNVDGKKCWLLETRGYLSIWPDPESGMLDIENAIKWWSDMISIMKNAPLFPLTRFADRLTHSIKIFGEYDKFDQLTTQVDSLLSERYGDFIAAEKCRDRAIVFFDNGKIIKAIKELHKAKIQWFAEETLHESLLAMIFIAKCYAELNLTFAGKYYALAAAFIALNSSDENLKKLVSKALIVAADCDYDQGAWSSFLELVEIGLRTQLMFSHTLDDKNFEKEFEKILFHLTSLLVITERFDEALFEFCKGRISKLQIDDWINETLRIGRNVWARSNDDELWMKIEEQLYGRPFGDLGTKREVIWKQLGITWNVTWNNDYQTSSLAEQFIAILQIILTELAITDLCLLQMNVEIDIEREDISEILLESIPSNSGRKWKIIFPFSTTEAFSEVNRLQTEMLATASTVLSEISLLPINKFLEVINECFSEGLSMKAFVANSYDVIYRKFVSEEFFNSFNRSDKTVPESNREFLVKEHEELKWFDKLGPGYDEDTINEFLENRYERSFIPIKFTLKQLVKDSDFIEIVEKLRADGWKDWHILLSLANITVNYRVREFHEISISQQIHNELFKEMLSRPESERSTPIPHSEFTETKIRQMQKINMIATLVNFGLECRQEIPDLESINDFLKSRYNYWDDDIEHDDPFIDREN